MRNLHKNSEYFQRFAISLSVQPKVNCCDIGSEITAPHFCAAVASTYLLNAEAHVDF